MGACVLERVLGWENNRTEWRCDGWGMGARMRLHKGQWRDEGADGEDGKSEEEGKEDQKKGKQKEKRGWGDGRPIKWFFFGREKEGEQVLLLLSCSIHPIPLSSIPSMSVSE